MSINNNTAHFVSIICYQNEPLGCVLTHISQLITHATNVYIAAAYFAVMLLSLLALLMVIKSQKFCISFVHSESQYIFSRQKNMAKFSDLFLDFQVLWKAYYLKKSGHTSMQFLRKICFFFVHMRNFSHTLCCTSKFSHSLSDGFTS